MSISPDGLELQGAWVKRNGGGASALQPPMYTQPFLSNDGYQTSDVDVRISEFRAELAQAAQRRDPAQVRRIVILLRNLSPQQLDACLALHYVVWTNELNQLASELISYGCDPFAADINGDTAIHYSAKGCNVKYIKHFHDLYGNAIFSVINNNHFNIMLTAAAETSDDRPYDILGMLEWMYLKGAAIDVQDMQGRTPLMWACRRGSNLLVQWLLSRGASLSARDHMGRTVLHMACLSSDEDTVLTVCEKGAVHYINTESIDDAKAKLPVQICWQRGHYFLGLTLRKYYWQYRLFGTVKIFRSMYSWYYWILVMMNLLTFLPMASRILSTQFECWISVVVWGGVFFATGVSWLSAFFSEPGFVKRGVVPDQTLRCDPNRNTQQSSKNIFDHPVTSAQGKLYTTERGMATSGQELIKLNREWGDRVITGTLPDHVARQYDRCFNRIQQFRESALRLMNDVGAERQNAADPQYIKLLETSPRKVCITCQMIKPFRAHHCTDCEHCIHRFDHHCVWIDTCVGIKNQRSFFFFLFFLTGSILANWYVVIIYYKAVLEQPHGGALSLITEPLFYIALTNSLVNVLWVGFVGYLFGRTCKSVITNITFYEYLKRPSHILRRFQGRTSGCCWDMSDLTIGKIVRNIYTYFTLSEFWDSIDYSPDEENASAPPPPPHHHKPHHNHNSSPVRNYTNASPTQQNRSRKTEGGADSNGVLKQLTNQPMQQHGGVDNLDGPKSRAMRMTTMQGDSNAAHHMLGYNVNYVPLAMS